MFFSVISVWIYCLICTYCVDSVRGKYCITIGKQVVQCHQCFDLFLDMYLLCGTCAGQILQNIRWAFCSVSSVFGFTAWYVPTVLTVCRANISKYKVSILFSVISVWIYWLICTYCVGSVQGKYCIIQGVHMVHCPLCLDLLLDLYLLCGQCAGELLQNTRWA
jgi:hypothetical protein